MRRKISLNEHATANHEALVRAFPDQFPDLNASFGWPDGWHHLVERVCRTAHEQNLPVVWRQIKEKFGGLRMYRAGGALRIDMIHAEGDRTSMKQRSVEPIDALISAAEQESLRTCMHCGGTGSQRVVDGYVFTLCDEHHRQFVRDHGRGGQ